MKLLILSNGKGEDSIAVTLLREFQRSATLGSLEINALPLVGSGSAYEKIGIPVIGPKSALPSGGFTFHKISSVIEDLWAGLFGTVRKQTQALKAENPDLILAVGDMFPVLMALRTQKPIIHIATAYSVHLRKIFPIETKLLQKCLRVFTRDPETAEHLKAHGVNAESCGNLMMDDEMLQDAHSDSQTPRPPDSQALLGIVPSSRMDAYDNVHRCLELGTRIPQKDAVLFLVSVAPNLDLRRMEQVARLFEKELTIRLDQQSSLGDVIRQSTAVMGMTGTGNEQVVGLGRPLILLQGEGPQSSPSRLKHYQLLLGDSVFIPKGNETEMGRQIGVLLNDPPRLAHMAKVGRQRMGEPGAARKIAEAIGDCLPLTRKDIPAE